jgi:hypothetical protein
VPDHAVGKRYSPLYYNPFNPASVATSFMWGFGLTIAWGYFFQVRREALEDAPTED